MTTSLKVTPNARRISLTASTSTTANTVARRGVIDDDRHVRGAVSGNVPEGSRRAIRCTTRQLVPARRVTERATIAGWFFTVRAAAVR